MTNLNKIDPKIAEAVSMYEGLDAKVIVEKNTYGRFHVKVHFDDGPTITEILSNHTTINALNMLKMHNCGVEYIFYAGGKQQQLILNAQI